MDPWGADHGWAIVLVFFFFKVTIAASTYSNTSTLPNPLVVLDQTTSIDAASAPSILALSQSNPATTDSQWTNGSCSAHCVYANMHYASSTWVKLTPAVFGTVHYLVDESTNHTSTSTELHTDRFMISGTMQSTFVDLGYTLNASDVLRQAGGNLSVAPTTTKTWSNGAVYPTDYYWAASAIPFRGRIPYTVNGEELCTSFREKGLNATFYEDNPLLESMPLPPPTYRPHVSTVDPEDPFGNFYMMSWASLGFIGPDAYRDPSSTYVSTLRSLWGNWTAEPLIEAIFSTCSPAMSMAGPDSAFAVTALLDTTVQYIPASTTAGSPTVVATPAGSIHHGQSVATVNPVSVHLTKTSVLGKTAPATADTSGTREMVAGSTANNDDVDQNTSAAKSGCNNIACYVMSPFGSPSSTADDGLAGTMQNSDFGANHPAGSTTVPSANEQSSVAPGGLATLDYSSRQTTVRVVTIGNSVATANAATEIMIGSRTLKPGGSAITSLGTTYSMATSMPLVHVNDQTVHIGTRTTTAIALPSPGASSGAVEGSMFTVDQAEPYVIGTHTMSPGETPVTFSGSVYSMVSYSASSSGVVLVWPASPASATTYTVNTGQPYIVGSQTLAVGQPAATIFDAVYTMPAPGTVVVSRLPGNWNSALMSAGDTTSGGSSTADVLSTFFSGGGSVVSGSDVPASFEDPGPTSRTDMQGSAAGGNGSLGNAASRFQTKRLRLMHSILALLVAAFI